MQKEPGWIFSQILWKETAFIPGLLAAGCGITQLWKVNKSKKQTIEENITR